MNPTTAARGVGDMSKARHEAGESVAQGDVNLGRTALAPRRQRQDEAQGHHPRPPAEALYPLPPVHNVWSRCAAMPRTLSEWCKVQSSRFG